MEIKEFCKKINAVPMSVIEDIKAELKERLWEDDFERVLEIIDKHISGEDQGKERIRNDAQGNHTNGHNKPQ